MNPYTDISEELELDYDAFIEKKILESPVSGFFVEDADLHESLFPHQRDTVKWALAGGCRAVFASFGLGKTRTQLEIGRQVNRVKGGLVLFIAPLGVRQEFTENDGPDMGMTIRYVRTDQDIATCDSGFMITNYERVRDGQIADFSVFTCVCLDEASVLRSFGSKTYQTFSDVLEAIPHRFVFTATPSPNRTKELIHYAGFLGVMDTGQALTRYFQRNSEKAGDLTLYPHKEREFWLWVSSWALFLSKPSDLGYSDEGYDLPELKVQFHRLPVDHSIAGADSWGQYKLLRDAALSLKDAAREKQLSILDRIAKAVSIIKEDQPDKHWLLWHHLEAERKEIESALPEAITAFGSQDLEKREELILGFSRGEHRILATKPEIAGSGCNFQRFCHANIFLGINYEFNDFIQAIHRTQRFQQKHPVEVHIIYTESEDQIMKQMLKKWEHHRHLTGIMQEIVKKYGLTGNALDFEVRRSLGVERLEKKGQYFTAVRNDTVKETKLMKSNSVGLTVTSIPFGNQYEYSPAYEDFGHTSGDEAFFAQMDFLIPELLRVTMPGRVCAVHVKDRLLFGSMTGLGMYTVNPFSDKTVAAFMKHGWNFCGRIVVVTDVVRENNQTYRLGHSEVCKDGTKMGCGTNEYILIFRKTPSDTSNSYADVPVAKSKESYPRRQWQIDASGFYRSSGDRLLTPEELTGKDTDTILRWYREYNTSNVYNYQEHVDLGRELEKAGRMPSSFMLFAPGSHYDHVWTDIVRMRTLNSNQSQKRNENHVCPLQLDLVERLIDRYSNPGDEVYDPFGGLMTVPYVAVQMDRRGRGTELNAAYWRFGVEYLQEAEYKKTVPTLFDFLGEDVA
ncbi:DNA methyltransferase [Tellurirhabdus bombi]|uniref:DNA methyltransferase n=1 Tax=Tellurirhabdus bombi TaxID=2907205 RepID=UPI001F1979BC|nr:DNA methyltransferase [Tellurirhabdus bombi]